MPTMLFEHDPVEFEPGDTVASALLRAGVTTFSRGPKYHRPRGPFCLSGSCAQCHMRVGGEPNVPTCETPATAGLEVERQNVLGSGDTDLLRAIDFLYPEKLDHHHLMTRFKALSAATQLIARRLSGIGEKPEKALAAVEAEALDFDTVVIGGGRSGLEAAAKATGSVLVVEQRPELAARAGANARVRTHTKAIGLFEEGGLRLVLAHDRERLLRITTREVVVATGGLERNLPFEANDLPGVFAARGLLRAVRAHRLFAGRRVVVVGGAEDQAVVARGLADGGLEVIETSAEPVRAIGRQEVKALLVREADGSERRIACELVAIAAPLQPSYELAAEVGAHAQFDSAAGGFPVAVDDLGRSSVPWVRVVGRAAGR